MRYGAPKIHAILKNNGEHVSLKRVQRYMHQMKIRSIVIKKFRYYAKSAPVPDNPNLLQGDFLTTGINQKWCTDITYIHTQKQGWTYLASVMDLHTRKILGYAYGIHMNSELAIKALKNAALNVKDTSGIIVHSDLGVQYTSHAFEEYIDSKKMIHSFSRKANPYDNACIESFHSILKKEEVNHRKYPDFQTASKAIFEFIEAWYNRKRIHGAIGYLTPQQAHEQYLASVA